MNRKPFERCSRVSIEIKRILSDLLRRKIKDPSLSEITITVVKISKDLKIAKIYFSFYRKSIEVSKVIEGFVRAKGYLKRELAVKLGLRYMPEIMFFYDDSFDYGAHMNELLNSI